MPQEQGDRQLPWESYQPAPHGVELWGNDINVGLGLSLNLPEPILHRPACLLGGSRIALACQFSELPATVLPLKGKSSSLRLHDTVDVEPAGQHLCGVVHQAETVLLLACFVPEVSRTTQWDDAFRALNGWFWEAAVPSRFLDTENERVMYVAELGHGVKHRRT